ncbi:hypothetical protein QBC33DRAFT_500201 [Phialemonium atrogriseum]|uniref:Copper acquisition factor BIM1-like domain-containing protein n=1 Tax=Phialemonium atrogriseum TaxID=1093897 RepID=A0AAJ0FDB4_9PEZI|nr:uncharacterized protein QBC33DRAFT_500201 [Phialemonium atrogriseum]KAK1763047.1 hypothetical protein QBC33DRAFT_500201 [Phialemonium atrogriseum]
MHPPSLSTILFLGAVTLSKAHFVLQIPTSLGFDDDAETESPCGGFDPQKRNNVTLWPVGGSAVGLLTTHSEATWDFKAAFLSDLETWVPLTGVLHQTGVGSFCEPVVPGDESWVGEEAVLQVVQHGHDGDLYQCAAIKFVEGWPTSTPAGCVNDSRIDLSWL